MSLPRVLDSHCHMIMAAHMSAAFVLLLVLGTAAAVQGNWDEACPGPSKFDPIMFNSTIYGNANMSDSIWHDDTWAFRNYGQISRLTLYKAWYYDGAWHDPGEFKGIQAWYGRYFVTDEVRLLFGAKRPHYPLNCTLYKHEVIVRAELQWDHIMRFMNFTTNRGRYCAWGFPDVGNVTKAVAEAPRPNTYIAALRGYEGKPLPPSLGGHKKRYIVQLGFAWAQMNCSEAQTRAARAHNTRLPAAGTAALATAAVATTAAAATAPASAEGPSHDDPLQPAGPAARLDSPINLQLADQDAGTSTHMKNINSTLSASNATQGLRPQAPSLSPILPPVNGTASPSLLSTGQHHPPSPGQHQMAGPSPR